MSMISSGPDRTPRNDRANSARLRGARSTLKAGGTQDSGRGEVDKEESKRRIRDAQNLMPMPRRSEPRPMPPGLEGQQYLAPGGMGGRMSGELDALMSLLTTPRRIARGAVEGGVRAVNPDFEMPDYSNAQIPGIDFIRDMMRGGGQGRPDSMGMTPLPRSFDPGTDALLRAYIRQMRGGE